MRILNLLILFFVLSGCELRRETEYTETAAIDAIEVAESDVTQECTVRQEWLNLNYDHEIDRQYLTPTDFLLLVYSHSPSFCQKKRERGELSDVPFQCNSPNKFGWVIHGLWAESIDAYITDKKNKHPRFCKGDLEAVELEILIPYLCMSPGTRLLQGEWEKHGSCIFDMPQHYFMKVQELYKQFGIPPVELKARDAMHWMKDNNAELKNKWLHLQGGEFGICLDLDFVPISCPRKN